MEKVFCWHCRKEKENGNIYGLCLHCGRFHMEPKTPEEIERLEKEIAERTR